MSRLEKHLNEANTSGATNMELAIVNAWNSPKKDNLDVADIIAGNLESYIKGKRGTGAIHTGGGALRVSLSPKWTGGQNPEPKTDLKIHSDKISLKKTGASQLMSAGKQESKGVFDAAFSNFLLDNRTEIAMQLERHIQHSLEDMAGYIQQGQGLSTKELKAGLAGEEWKQKIEKADQAHKEFTQSFRESLETGGDFKRHLVFEAATGAVKFGGNDGTADTLVVFDNNGGVKYHKIRTVDDSYVAELASKSKIRMSWKSQKKDTGIRTLYSTIRLDIKEQLDKLSDEDMLNENIFKNVYNLIKNKVMAAWNKMKDWVLSSYENLLEFLGFEGSADVSIKF